MNSTTCLCGRHQAPKSDLPDGTLRFIPLVKDEKRPIMKKCQYQDGWPAGQWIFDMLNLGYGIGLLPWSSNVVVIDCDIIETADWQIIQPGVAKANPTVVTGMQQLTSIISFDGVVTPMERTKSGGAHLYFRQNPTWRVMSSKIRRLGTAIDVKATGLVACYPTAGYSPVNGVLYQMKPEALAELPESLARMIEPVIGKPLKGGSVWTWNRIEAIIQKVRDSQPGERNQTLNWAAWKLREAAEAGIVTQLELSDLLTTAAEEAGLDQQEAELTTRSGLGTYGADWR